MISDLDASSRMTAMPKTPTIKTGDQMHGTAGVSISLTGDPPRSEATDGVGTITAGQPTAHLHKTAGTGSQRIGLPRQQSLSASYQANHPRLSEINFKHGEGFVPYRQSSETATPDTTFEWRMS